MAETATAHIWDTWAELNGSEKLELIDARYNRMVNVGVEATTYALADGQSGQAERDPAFAAASEAYWLAKIMLDAETGRYN